MRKFAFRLESVLRVRRVQEDGARAQLSLANRDVQIAAARVNARRERYDDLPRPHGVHESDTLERIWFSLDAAAGAVGYAHRERVDAEARAAERRGEWTEARRRTQVLERLRTRAHDEWLIDARRDEDRQVDDLVVARARHRRARLPQRHEGTA